jgi:signal transduction histidine kinase
MTTQPYRVNLSIASPSEIERTARELMMVRDDFLITGSPSLWMPRPLILASWERCRTLQVNPSQRCAPLAVARETQLECLRAENALLIQAARPALTHLIDFFAESGYVVVLSDAQGRLLDVVGDAAVRRRLERIDFVPGGNWSEAAAGTNAIGTALADGHVVQLMASEHYCDGWQDLTCTAAPIRHPFTNKIIGILDVTGNYRLIRPFLTSLIAMAALEIERRLQSLLSFPHSHDEWQHYYYNVVIDHPGMPPHTQTIENAMTQKPGTDPLKLDSMMQPSTPKQWQLNPQERRAHDAERLAAAAGTISASLDLSVTLEKIVEQAAYLLGTEQAGIHLFDERERLVSMRLLATHPPFRLEQSPALAALLKDSGAAALVRERGEPVVIDDVLSSPLLPEAVHTQMGMRSSLLLPLVTARGVIGFITVSSPIPHTWAIDDIRLGLTFATQSATALENARLFDTLQQHNRHIETLNTIAHILSTLPDPSQHLDLVLQRITEITAVDASVLLLLDQQSNQFTLAAQCSRVGHTYLDAKSLPLQTLYLVAQRVVTLHDPLQLCVNHCDELEIADTLRHIGFHHMMAVPLATSNSILGVLLVSNTCCNDRDHYHNACCNDRDKEDLEFFSTVGQQLALALKNAQLLRSASEMEALREADRLKSGFLAAVSHDLRSPLTAIRASVESLLDADGIQSALSKEHLLHNIAGQTHRLGQLVDQLLDLSKIEAGVLALDCDWVELPVLIHDAIAEFGRLHPGCWIEEVIDEYLPLAYIDSDRLVQVLWNLLENAYKYAIAGTPLHVEACLQDNEVLLSVADRCPGIPRNEHEKVFQRFYRLARDQHSHTKGSGLGLAVCKGIVEAHHGRIWVEDREGGGCVFRVALRLPASGPLGFDASKAQELFA